MEDAGEELYPGIHGHVLYQTEPIDPDVEEEVAMKTRNSHTPPAVGIEECLDRIDQLRPARSSTTSDGLGALRERNEMNSTSQMVFAPCSMS